MNVATKEFRKNGKFFCMQRLWFVLHRKSFKAGSHSPNFLRYVTKAFVCLRTSRWNICASYPAWLSVHGDSLAHDICDKRLGDVIVMQRVLCEPAFKGH